MNHIKYINPKTGERKRIRIQQPSFSKLSRFFSFLHARRPTMAEADTLMYAKGFVRAGIRWGRQTG